MSLTVLAHTVGAERPQSQQITELRARGCPGQIVSLSFSLCHAERVRVGVQTSPGLEAFLVNVWEQPGVGLRRTSPRRYPELLLKSDMDSLRGTYRWRRAGLFKQALPYYEGPDVRTYGPACLDLLPGNSKQVWVSARLPLAPGLHRAEVNVRGLQPPGPVTTIPVYLETLPFTLAEPTQDRVMWFRGTLDPRESQHALTLDDMEVQLRDIHEHGFCSVTIGEKTASTAQKVIDLAETIGFDRHAILLYPHRPGSLRFRKLKPVYYLSDEFDGHGPEVELNHKRIHDLVQGKAKTLASLLSARSLERLGRYRPDLTSYNISHSAVLLHSLQNFPESLARPAYYYWPAHLEQPDLHRILAGVGLWLSQADGISPYCYQHLPVYPSDPFDDRQPWEPDFRLHGVRQDFRHHMTTYPGRNGIISTLQWEAMREGLVDLAYLTTWEGLVRSAPANRAATSRRRLDQRFRSLDLRLISPASEAREPLPGCAPDTLERIRQLLIDEILDLRSE